VEEPGQRTVRAHRSLLMAEVNDRIFAISHLHSDDCEFLCECSNESCTETLQLTLQEYAVLKAQSDRPLLKLPGHPG
jgi:hypothetical protein